MTTTLGEIAAIAGPDAARSGDAEQDAIDGVTPDVVVTPASAETLAATLAWARTRQASTVIRGSGSKLGWGRPPNPIQIAIDMRRLGAVLRHASGDLIATVEAGASLQSVNEVLAQAGQVLPLDPPHAARATIGGLIATNDSGPLRHRFGAPRDLILGVQFATTDGQLSRSGGAVVKNVAGYDLPKLLCGSWGSLGAIVSATFRLAPLPRTSKTVVATTTDVHLLATAVRTIMGSQLDPTAVEIDVDLSRSPRPAALILQFTSPASSVDDQVRQARALVTAPAWSVTDLEDAQEQACWRDHRAGTEAQTGLLARVTWRPAELDSVLASLGREATWSAGRLIGRASLGSGLLHVEGDAAVQTQTLELLRRLNQFSQVTVVHADRGVRARADLWGLPPDRQRLLDAIKLALDPERILNAGRGPL